MLYVGEIEKDFCFGFIEIVCVKFKYELVGNEEDLLVIWDDEVGKWCMLICKVKKGY